jgi:hypothetical protein
LIDGKTNSNQEHLYFFNAFLNINIIHTPESRIYIYKIINNTQIIGTRCQRIISTQKLKLLGEVSVYDLYYSLTHPLKWKSFGLETCIDPHYLVLNFYQINGDDEIRTRDHLVIKALIPCQRTISTQKLKLLGKVPGYNLYYSLTPVSKFWRRIYPFN